MKTIKTYFLLLVVCLCFSSCEIMLEALSAMASTPYSPYGYPMGYYGAGTPSGNMNYLLDPMYAVSQVQQQQQYYNNLNQQFIQNAVNETNAKEQKEYNQAREAYKKIGKDLTLEEYRAMQGQAIMMANGEYTDNTENSSSINSNGSYSPVEQYRRWEKIVESNYNTLSIGGYSSTNDSGTPSGKAGEMWSSGGSYTTIKQNMRKAQEEMRKCRKEAAAIGINITPSKWENADISF